MMATVLSAVSSWECTQLTSPAHSRSLSDLDSSPLARVCGGIPVSSLLHLFLQLGGFSRGSFELREEGTALGLTSAEVHDSFS